MLIVVAAQAAGRGIGRIRMRYFTDASATSLMPLVQDSIKTCSVVHTNAWLGCEPLETKGHRHRITFLRRQEKFLSDLLSTDGEFGNSAVDRGIETNVADLHRDIEGTRYLPS